MSRSLCFNKEQLFWPEELNPEYCVEVQMQAWGEGVFGESPNMARQPIALRDLSSLKDSHGEKNIWRSWTVYSDIEMKKAIGTVPLILDIDDESEPANFRKAYDLTRACLDAIEIENGLIHHTEQLRVVFSGRKGFHIEIKPSLPVEAQAVRQRLLHVLRQRIPQSYFNVFYESTALELSHMWVRLTGTLYSWRSKDGITQSRKIFPLQIEEFRAMPVEEILALAWAG